MKKIVVAIDSFKGSLTSREAAEALHEAILRVVPAAECCTVPLADGGEGWVEALTKPLGGEVVFCQASDPLGRPVTARYGRLNGGESAIIELSEASGLTRLRHEERNPLHTSTRGTGEVILAALRGGARELLLGLGGSATHDAGTGILAALGARFYDKQGRELSPTGASIEDIEQLDLSGLIPEARALRWQVACDVRNPLCGPEGAAAVYAPQKGADAAMVERLERGTRHWAGLLARHSGKEVATLPGGGAAGGVAATLKALMGAELKPGIEWALELVGFEQLIRGASLIITGEGSIDRQTLMGKLPGGVLRAAQKQGIPVVALGGRVEPSPELEKSGFAAIRAITPPAMPLAEAMRPEVARRNLQRAIEELLPQFFNQRAKN